MMSNENKTAEELINYRQVFPNDANPGGTMFGGRVMEIMDASAAMAAARYSETVNPVTASVEALRFRLPVQVGDTLKTNSKVVYTGRTSIIVKVDVIHYEQGLSAGELCTNAHFFFVALDNEKRPTSVPTLAVTTDAGKRAWKIASEIREQALRFDCP